MVVTRDRDASLLSEQRRRGPPADDFATRYAAAAIGPGHQAAETTSAVALAGDPVFWLAPDGRAFVVDERWFSDLAVVDVNRLSPGDERAVGTLRLLGVVEPRDLARLLLQADVILTWAHIGSTVQLIDEAQDVRGWRGRFEGSHEYFTSSRNVRAFAFDLCVDHDGAVRVVGA